jgi:hypothetical protein
MPTNDKSVKKRVRKQINSILRETNNPAILQDVIDTEFGVIPGTVDDLNERQETNGFVESIVKNTVDGKTFNKVDDE